MYAFLLENFVTVTVQFSSSKTDSSCSKSHLLDLVVQTRLTGYGERHAVTINISKTTEAQ